MKRPALLIPIMITLLIVSCWDRQDIDVNQVEMPQYELFGKITYVDEEQGISELIIDLVHLEVYQGELLEPRTVMTDSVGGYSLPDLYRGRYHIVVTQQGLKLFDQDVGMINFDNKEYNIEVNRAIQLVEKQIDFAWGEKAMGLIIDSGTPIVLTNSSGHEQLRSTSSTMEIEPIAGSNWRHNGLAKMGSGQFASVRRQIDTTWVDGMVQISGAQYYLSVINGFSTLDAGKITINGDQITHNFSQSGYWVMRSNFLGQKSLYNLDGGGTTIEKIPLSTNQAGIFSFIETQDGFMAVDTSDASLWFSTPEDSLHGLHKYLLYDDSDNPQTLSDDYARFIAMDEADEVFIATNSGVWLAEIIGR